MDSDNRQIVGGATISYILIAINALYGFIVTPYIVSQIGDASFGVYKTITSFAASLMVIDLGIGGTVQRYIANYRASDKSGLIGNFVYMFLMEAAILAVIATSIVLGIYFNLNNIFKNGLSQDEIELAKQLFLVLCITIVFHLFENVLNGIITGYGKFIVSNGLRLFRILLRLIGTFALLFVWKSPLTLVIIDCALVIILLIFEIFYSIHRLKLKISFTHFDSSIFKESLVYSLMMFITALANQMNGNLDNIVIGAFMTSKDVAVYSMAIIIFGMFEQIACSISSVLLPKMSFVIEEGGVASAKEYVISVGRVQLILLGAIYGAFIVIGKDFISIWIGETYIPAYYIAMIIMGPAILELCVNVCLTMLRVVNKLKFKTIVTVLMMVLNAVLTIVGVKYWGYYMAAIATALSYLIGSVLIMNMYYHKEFGYNMFTVYSSIFSRTFLCIILSSIMSWCAIYSFDNHIYRFVLGLMVFIIVYGISLVLWGLNTQERNTVKKIIRRFQRC